MREGCWLEGDWSASCWCEQSVKKGSVRDHPGPLLSEVGKKGPSWDTHPPWSGGGGEHDHPQMAP